MEKRVSNKTKIVIVFITLLFFSSVFGMIQYYHPPQASSQIVNPNLSSIGETGTTSTAVNYYTNNAVANSGTTTLNFPVVENSTYTDRAYNVTSDWTEIATPGDYNFTQTLNMPTTYFYVGSVVELNQSAIRLAYFYYYNPGSGVIYYTAQLYVIYANLSINGHVFSWNYKPQTSDLPETNTNEYGNRYYLFIDPNWTISNIGVSNEWYGSATISFTYVSFPYGFGGTSSDFTVLDPPIGPASTNYATRNTIVENPSFSSDVSVPFAIGYYISPTSQSTTFTISQYESSFDITWSSNAETNPQYNGNSPSGTSGTITGSLTVNSFTVYIVSEAVSGISSISFSYYLSSQYQISTASTTETSSPTYTYTQVSGTTNQASASFSFSGSTPSTAVFIPYESGTNSLTTDSTNIVFTPTITVSNPYYTYTQNQLVFSISGSSTYSTTSSNTQNPSYTLSSLTYKSSTSPSWTVDLNLYGNVFPTISQSISFVGTSEVSVTFTSTQPDFSGELQTYLISWGDGTTSTYSNLATGTYTETHIYSGTYQGTFSQTYDIYVQDTNVPNPSTNGLSGLTTTTSQTPYTMGIVVNPTTPDSVLHPGQSIYMNITDTNLITSGANITVNGVTATATLISGTTYDFKYSSSIFGISAVTVTWNITSGKVYDLFSTQYATPIEPTTNSSYVTALFSNTATHSYQITLSAPPSGTGFYQQLLTINDPSSYGINTITSPGSNVQFAAQNGTLLYAWEQSINSSALQVWVKNYYGNSIIDMQVLPSFENDFSETGYLGNATISNIKYVFPNMTVSGTAGLADTLPTGSLPGSVGFYAYSVGGDYIYMPMQDYGTNTNISFYVWSNGIGDFFFDANSAGTGNAFRFDTRSGSDDSQFMPTNSWTSWVSPPSNSYTPSPSTWYEGIIHFNSNGTVIGYWSYASQNAYGQNATSYYTVAHDGNYIGFIGDGDGSAYVTYWNGLKINGTTSMPLATISSIGTGLVFQANATADNTTLQHYQSFEIDTTNLTNGEYTYSIPDSFNNNYITIYYNSSWSINYASYGFSLGIQATSSGKMPYLTFSGIKGIGTLTMTFTEPLVIGQPLGTMSLGVLPSIAIDGNGFFELPNDLLHWTANGIPIDPSGFSVVVGKPVLLKAFSGAGVVVYSTTYTPTEEVTFLQTYVNITEFQFNNLNSTDEVDIQAISNNVTQNIALVGPYGTGASSQTVYLPSGNYTFKYTELNYTSGQVESGTSTATAPLTNYDGEYWVTLAGLTIYQLGNQVKYTNSSIQKSIQSLSVIIALNDSAIKNLTLGVDLNLTATNSSIQNVLQKILISNNFINDTIFNVNNSLQARFNTVNDIIHTFQSNITILDTYINDTINTINKIITNVNTNLTTANSIIGEIKIIDTTNFTALNSTIKSNFATMISNQNFEKDVLATANNNITLFYNYQKDLINSTSNNILVKEAILNSTANIINTNLTFDYKTLSSLIGTNNLNVSQNIIFSKNLINTNNLIYKTQLALNDYVMSGGTGVITLGSGTTVPAYQNILDPYETNTFITYSNLTTNQTTIWFGNPINSTYTNVIVTDNPTIAIYFNSSYTGQLNLTYYNTTYGLTKVKEFYYNLTSASYFPLSLNKQYLERNYIIEIQLNKTSFKNGGLLQSEIQWGGQIADVWTLNNGTHTYSLTMNLPGDAGYYGTVDIKTLHGAFMNTTSQIETITQGFPNGVTPAPSDVKIKDSYTGTYMTLGSEYQVSSNGIYFQRLNYTADTYYISFVVTSNITTGQDITIPLGSQSQQSLNGQLYDYRQGTYTNSNNQKMIANLILNLPNSEIPTNVFVIVVDGSSQIVISNTSIGVIGSTIQVSGVSIPAGSTITVEVYYNVKTISSTNFLFKPIPSLLNINMWDIIGLFILIMGALVAQYAYRNRKQYSKKYRIVSIYAVILFIWFIFELAYIGGII